MTQQFNSPPPYAPAPGPAKAWVPVTLPSRGFFYRTPDGRERLPGGRVYVSKLTFNEDSLLQSNGTDVTGRIDGVIRAACQVPKPEDDGVPPLPADELLLTDRIAIVVYQRVVSFGGDYTFNWQCGACRATNKQKVDLSALPEVTPDDAQAKLDERGRDERLDEPWDVPLIDEATPTVVRCRFLRAKDERAVLKEAKRARMTSNDPSDPSHAFRLAHQIVAINGRDVSSPAALVDKLAFIRRPISAADTRRIVNATDRRETGIDTRMQVSCRCGNETTISMPWDAEFFQPADL